MKNQQQEEQTLADHIHHRQGQKASETFNLRLSIKERHHLDLIANHHGVSAATIIKALIEQEIQRVINTS
jgi:predicted DNA-binding protein